MKTNLLFKNSLLAIICCLIISSCSQSRYGSLAKVKADKPIANTEKNHEIFDDNSIKNEQVFLEENIENEIYLTQSTSISENNSKEILEENNKIFSTQKAKKSFKINELIRVPSIQKIFKSSNDVAIKTQVKNNVGEGGLSGLALAGFICGVVGFILVILTGWAFLLGTFATVFSAIGLADTINNNKRGKGLAIAGLVLGIICISIFWILAATI